MWQLTSAVRHYPWGSRTVIPELLGEPSPAERPYAERWVGAHPLRDTLQPIMVEITMLGTGSVVMAVRAARMESITAGARCT